jgi:hypothetical protein
MPDNPWPDFDLTKNRSSVRNVILELGRGISEKTQDLIRFHVDTTLESSPDQKFVHRCTLWVVKLSYFYPFMTVMHGFDLYPAYVVSDVDPKTFKAASENELVEHLKKVFSSETTKKTVELLLDAAI